MSKHDPLITLKQIADNCRKLQELCVGKTLQTMATDWRSMAALERLIEVVGEAVKRLPLEIRDQYPAVPWKEIAGTRDHLIHGYDDVEPQILWDAVQQDVPSLITTVDKMIRDIESQNRK